MLCAISQQDVRSTAMNQSNVAEDADLDFEQSEILERARLSDVLEVLVAVSGDTGVWTTKFSASNSLKRLASLTWSAWL